MLTTLILGLVHNFCRENPTMDGEEMLVTSKKVFRDEEEHEINFHYGDGLAISEDKTICLTYPKQCELTEEMQEYMRKYDGIPEPRDYTNRDIASAYGVVRKFLSSEIVGKI